jgi:cytochrome c oxidase subunit IV
MREILPPKALVLTWLGLLACLAATLSFAFVPAGNVNLVVALTISVVKTTLVLVWFIKLPESPYLTWAAAAAGLFWLAILFALTSTDYLTRTMVPT